MSDVQNLPATRPAVTAGGQVGALVPQSIDEAWRLSEAFAKAKILPRGITEPAQVMLVICGGAEVGFGPFQSLQSFYLVNNRLTLWGDAIPALLWSNGFKLKEWYENNDPAYPDNMVAKCIITRPDGEQIEGEFSVADAKEAKLWGKDGPWQTARKRMLKMRARAFAARDGASDVLRGVAIREEVEDYDVITEIRTDPQPLHAGFTDAAAPKRRGRPPKSAQGSVVVGIEQIAGASAPQTADKAPVASAGPHFTSGFAESGETYLMLGDEVSSLGRLPTYIDGKLFSSVGQEGAAKLKTYAQHPTGTASRNSSGSATDVSTDSAAETSSPDASEPSQPGTSDPEVQDGYAEPGEIYLMADTPMMADNRRAAFKDGAVIGAIDDWGLLPVYDEHPPADAEIVEGPQLPPEVATYAAVVRSATDFKEVKRALADFQKTQSWKAMSNDEADEVRFNTWDIMVETGLAATLDPATDISAFRLWIEWEEDPEAIEAMLSKLEDHPDFKAKPDNLKDNIRAATAKRLEALAPQ